MNNKRSVLVYYIDKDSCIFDVFLMQDVRDAKGFIKFIKEDKEHVKILNECSIVKAEIWELKLGSSKKLSSHKI